MTLHGRTALISGGSRGIGAAIARHLAAAAGAAPGRCTVTPAMVLATANSLLAGRPNSPLVTALSSGPSR